MLRIGTGSILSQRGRLLIVRSGLSDTIRRDNSWYEWKQNIRFDDDSGTDYTKLIEEKNKGYSFRNKSAEVSPFAIDIERAPLSQDNIRENLNDIHIMSKLDTLTDADLLSNFQQVAVDKLTIAGRKPRFGDMLEHKMSMDQQLQRYMNMSRNRTLKRPAVEDVKCWIQDSDYSKPATRFLIHGTRYAGKTVAAHQIADWGVENGHFVIFTNMLHYLSKRAFSTEIITKRVDISTQAYVTVEGKKGFKTRYEPLMPDGNFRPELKDALTYDQNYGAGVWLETLRHMNSKYLKEMKSTRMLKVGQTDKAEDQIPIGTDLLTIVNEGLSRERLRCDTMKFIIEHIKEQAPELAEKGHPVLVVTDRVNYLTQGCNVTIYPNADKVVIPPNHRHMKKANITERVTDSRRLNAIRYLTELHKNDWSGANIVGCTTSEQVFMGNHRNLRANYHWSLGKHNDRSFIETDGEDLHELLGDTGFNEIWHPFIPIRLPDYTDKELEILQQFYYKLGILTGRTATVSAQEMINTLADGNIGRYYFYSMDMF